MIKTGPKLILPQQSIITSSRQATDCSSSCSRDCQSHPIDYSRRYFIVRAAKTTSLAGLGLWAHPLLAASRKKERIIELYIPRTGESIRSVYWTPTDGYIRESIKEISIAMRDGRTDAVKTINKRTLDIISALQRTLKPRKPTHLISGYRSPVTNRRVGGAKESYHVKGMASDIKMPGVGYSRLLRAAKRLKAGGVGRYTRSGFVHVDCGPIRYWGHLDDCDCSKDIA
jgi:uncharacterized protein YcbK (DUF882 family)